MAGTAVKRKQTSQAKNLTNKKQQLPSKVSRKVEEAAVELANEGNSSDEDESESESEQDKQEDEEASSSESEEVAAEAVDENEKVEENTEATENIAASAESTSSDGKIICHNLQQ